MYTLKAITNIGEFNYELDNTGKTDVSEKLQNIFNELSQIDDISVTMIFSPGCFLLDKPITVKIPSIAIKGTGHGGVEIHGNNTISGTVIRFSKNCGSECIVFETAKRKSSFPVGETPWKYGSLKVSLERINFVGHNNTGVDTAGGYSRFKGDNPNFRELKWYPTKDRYENAEKDGQKAIVLKQLEGDKIEMFDMQYCYFTEVFTAVDVEASDVSTIHHCWFAQLVDGIVYHGPGQVFSLHDNCFADLETGVKMEQNMASTFHDNGFAYVSKCFILNNAEELSIHHNTVKNWAMATGTASCSAFLYLGGKSRNVSIDANVIHNAMESHVKTRTIDETPNGRAFIQVENCKNLMFTNNLVDTFQTKPAVKFVSCTNVMTNNNLIQPETDMNEIEVV